MPAKATITILLVFAIITALLAACGDEDEQATATPSSGGAESTATATEAGTETPDESALDGTDWLLAAINGADIDLQEPITLSFSDGQSGGFSGCNEYGGTYTATDSGDFEVNELSWTDMACETGMDLEDDYLTALQQAAHYELIAGERLELSDSSGETLLVFTPDQRQAFDGTSWSLAEIDGQPPVANTHPTLELRAGQVSGSTGCNQYGGNYTADGEGELSISDLFWTERGCPEPPSVMEQEQAVLDALQHAASYELDPEGNRLLIVDGDGQTRLVFASQSDQAKRLGYGIAAPDFPL